MKIYTKKGDAGYTTNLLGEQYLKCDELMELQGSIDEVNANIGVLRSKLAKLSDEAVMNNLDMKLKTIQFNLYEIGVELSSKFTKLLINMDSVKFLEDSIDEMTKLMPPLNNFLYYSGKEEAVYANVIRAVTRRAERAFVRYMEKLGRKDYGISYSYVNRLSDFFFTLARFINHESGGKEEIMLLNKTK